MTQMNSEDTFIRKTNYNTTDLVGNFVLRTSNQTNASSGYSAIISPVPEPEPPADYEMPQISRQCGRGGVGYNIYDNRLSKYNRRTGLGHYDNDGYLNLGNSKQSNASSGSFASVSPVNQGAYQGNPNQLNFTGAPAYYPNYLRQQPCSPSQPPQLPPARRPTHVPVGDQKLKQKRCTKKKLCSYIFVIIIFLGISLTVAFSTMNRQKSDEMESLVNGKLQGQDEQLTNINHTVLKTVTTFENALRFEVDKFQNDSHDEMLETMKNMSKDLNTELTDKMTETKKNMTDDLKTELSDKMTETKKNMSDDLKTELADKMTETKRNMSKDLKTELTNKMMETKKNMSEELVDKMTETKKNMSEDLKTELTNKMMETKKNMSEELADKMTETKKNMSEDLKTELTNKMMETKKNMSEELVDKMTETKKNMSEDLKTELTNKMMETKKNMSEELVDKMTETKKNMSEELNDKMAETKKNMSEDFKTEIADKMTETKKNMSEYLKTELTNKMTETKKNMSEDLKTELTKKMTETKKNMSEDFKTEIADKMTETKKNMSEDLKTELTDIMMEAMQVMFEDVKTELTEYINKTFSHRIDQGGGTCIHVTMGDCVADCYNICDGDFQSCNTCTGYITCANRNLYNRPCFGNLVWDDTTKSCEATSNTCNMHVQGTTS
uniref:Uncharacterized protein PFB0145c-like n=1 Tax=Crassostrea virginica TaxID=6565 RepID=A0A8B8CQ95_CRAVI|nr:uncharacterized protein PFB0145c-like [Crassostrea virginica]